MDLQLDLFSLATAPIDLSPDRADSIRDYKTTVFKSFSFDGFGDLKTHGIKYSFKFNGICFIEAIVMVLGNWYEIQKCVAKDCFESLWERTMLLAFDLHLNDRIILGRGFIRGTMRLNIVLWTFS